MYPKKLSNYHRILKLPLINYEIYEIQYNDLFQIKIHMFIDFYNFTFINKFLNQFYVFKQWKNEY